MVAYATRADVYNYGLPRGSLYLHARAVASVNVSSNVLVVDGHGCDVNTPIQFDSDMGGSLAAPLVAGVLYYALPVTGIDTHLQVAATVDGAPIDLGDAGENMRLIVPIGPQMDALLETFSRWVDSMMIGHTVPLSSPFPDWVRYVVAVRTAAALARALGLGSSADRILEAERDAIADAARLARGVPLRDGAATAEANLAIGASPAGAGRYSISDPSVVP